MLRRNSSQSQFPNRKGLDVILKHKIRNLRAKLKTLLSSQSCVKYSHRQKQVKKIQRLQNKQFYMNKTLFNKNKNLFTFTNQQPKQLWYTQKHNCNIMTIFNKLNKQEIQQIQQDMIYYLGEDNVQPFKQFLNMQENLKIKASNKQNLNNPIRRFKTLKQQNSSTQRRIQSKKQSQTERKDSYLNQLPKFNKNCSINQNFFAFRNSIQSNQSSHNQSNKRLKTANLIQSRASTITKRSTQKQRLKFQASYLGNRQNFLKNRRLIQQQQNAQRIITKINMQMKQQKAIDIFKMTQQAFVSTIKEKNNYNDQRTKKILQEKYKKNVTFGSIVQLNQQLRKIYIKKISQNNNTLTVPQQKIIEKRKYDTTLSNFFTQTNSHYKSRF